MNSIWKDNSDFYRGFFKLLEEKGATDYIRLGTALAGMPSILDMGCGIGLLYKYLHNAGFSGDYLGIDYTDDFIEEAKELYGSDLFMVGDMRTINLDRNFNACVSLDFLRYIKPEDRIILLNNIIPHIEDRLILCEPIVWISEPWVEYEADGDYALAGEPKKLDIEWEEGPINPQLTYEYLKKIKGDSISTAVTPRQINKKDATDNLIPDRTIDSGKRARTGETEDFYVEYVFITGGKEDASI